MAPGNGSAVGIINRRVKVLLVWMGICAVLILSQPLLLTNIATIGLFIEKSVWAVGIILAGITGGDAFEKYAERKYGTGQEPKEVK